MYFLKSKIVVLRSRDYSRAILLIRSEENQRKQYVLIQIVIFCFYLLLQVTPNRLLYTSETLIYPSYIHLYRTAWAASFACAGICYITHSFIHFLVQQILMLLLKRHVWRKRYKFQLFQIWLGQARYPQCSQLKPKCKTLSSTALQCSERETVIGGVAVTLGNL